MDLQLKDKRVLITGAFGGIGRALVIAFQLEGAEVFAAEPYHVDQVAHRLASFTHPPRYLRCDYRDPVSVKQAVADAQPDIVVANAGVTHAASITQVSLEQWNEVIAVNLTGNFLLGQAAALQMKPGGSIVFVGSWVQTLPQPNVGAYGPSKAGLKMLALCLAKEVAPRGVRVNVVSPGIIDSGMAARQMDRQPARRQRAKNVAISGRLGTAQEVANACLFLCSPVASYIFGADLLVDGGASLGVH